MHAAIRYSDMYILTPRVELEVYGCFGDSNEEVKAPPNSDNAAGCSLS